MAGDLGIGELIVNTIVAAHEKLVLSGVSPQAAIPARSARKAPRRITAA